MFYINYPDPGYYTQSLKMIAVLGNLVVEPLDPNFLAPFSCPFPSFQHGQAQHAIEDPNYVIPYTSAQVRRLHPNSISTTVLH